MDTSAFYSVIQDHVLRAPNRLLFNVIVKNNRLNPNVATLGIGLVIKSVAKNIPIARTLVKKFVTLEVVLLVLSFYRRNAIVRPTMKSEFVVPPCGNVAILATEDYLVKFTFAKKFVIEFQIVVNARTKTIELVLAVKKNVPSRANKNKHRHAGILAANY